MRSIPDRRCDKRYRQTKFVGWAGCNEAQRACSTVLGFALLSPTYLLLASNPRVPLIPLILPVTALAAFDGFEGVDQVDAAQVLRHLVAQLTRYAQAQWRAVRNRQRLAVEFPRQQRLRMVRIVETQRFVVFAAVVHRVVAA